MSKSVMKRQKGLLCVCIAFFHLHKRTLSQQMLSCLFGESQPSLRALGSRSPAPWRLASPCPDPAARLCTHPDQSERARWYLGGCAACQSGERNRGKTQLFQAFLQDCVSDRVAVWSCSRVSYDASSEEIMGIGLQGRPVACCLGMNCLQKIVKCHLYVFFLL